jgi:hypothetical protein
MGACRRGLLALERLLLRLKRKKDVLFIVQNEIMLSHVLIGQACVRDDPRIRCWFCLVTPQLCFDRAALLRAGRLRFIPRFLAKRLPWDLIVYADHKPGFRADRPKIYIGHGHYAGKVPKGGGDYVLGPWARDARGRLVYDKIFRSSEDAARRSAESHPDAAPRLRVVGSPIADDLRADAADRAARCRSLGLDPGRRTILIATTWGEGSIVQREAETLRAQVARLAAADNVIVSAHLNNFRTVYAATRRWEDFEAGLRQPNVHVVKPTASAHRLLPCADLVVMELTSLGFYFTVLERPIVYYDNPEIPHHPTSLAVEMKRAAHVIRDLTTLDTDIERAVAGFDRAAMRRLAAQLFGHPGASRARYREEFYDSLGLRPRAAGAAAWN